MNKKQEVVLVNENDEELGKSEKMQAHIEGTLHRAFSIFIFNSAGKLLLQKRANEKYHSGGLWTNTCCGHPLPDELISNAVNQRLKEEMGMQCKLHFGYKILYKADVGENLTEHEVDYLYFGTSDETPEINSNEASEYRFVSLEELRSEINSSPENFTEWFKLIYEKAFEFFCDQVSHGEHRANKE